VDPGLADPKTMAGQVETGETLVARFAKFVEKYTIKTVCY
jgi:hypothetical protein